MVEEPPAFEEAKHQVEPEHAACELDKRDEAVGSEKVVDVGERAAQVGGGVDAVGGEDNVELAVVLSRGLLFDVDGGVSHAVVLSKLALPFRDERGRDIGESVLDWDATPYKPVDNPFGG